MCERCCTCQCSLLLVLQQTNHRATYRWGVPESTYHLTSTLQKNTPQGCPALIAAKLSHTDCCSSPCLSAHLTLSPSPRSNPHTTDRQGTRRGNHSACHPGCNWRLLPHARMIAARNAPRAAGSPQQHWTHRHSVSAHHALCSACSCALMPAKGEQHAARLPVWPPRAMCRHPPCRVNISLLQTTAYTYVNACCTSSQISSTSSMPMAKRTCTHTHIRTHRAAAVVAGVHAMQGGKSVWAPGSSSSLPWPPPATQGRI